MDFASQLADRSAAQYAEFLLPHLAPDFEVLDAGCGPGTISLGLAARVGHVIGVERDEGAFVDAQEYAGQNGIGNIEFRAGDIYHLDFPDHHFDACLCHSVLETLDRPLDALREIKRTLKPGGVLGLAAVEYGGLILAGPHEQPLRQFYEIRLRLWQIKGIADPYRGRRLRGLMLSAGFERVDATSVYICHGTEAKVKTFGLARAEECREDEYALSAQQHGLATQSELASMQQAWLEWSQSSQAYAAFAWCRAIGWKPVG